MEDFKIKNKKKLKIKQTLKIKSLQITFLLIKTLNSMDFLNESDYDEHQLPQASELTSDLFNISIDKYSTKDETGDKLKFDVDQFLMDNNFQYLPLDYLIRSVNGLSEDATQNLLDDITTNYEEYVKFFQVYNGNDNEALNNLQDTQNNINNFTQNLTQLIDKDIPKTQEEISDVVEYLKSLDNITQQLKDHELLLNLVQFTKQLSKTLHDMCRFEQWDDNLVCQILKEVNNNIQKCQSLLRQFNELNSPFINHINNEYQGLLQEFQISLKIFTETCLADTDKYPKISQELVSILRSNKKI